MAPTRQCRATRDSRRSGCSARTRTRRRRRPPEDAARRTGDAGFRGRRTESPHVEVVAARLERLDLEQRCRQTLCLRTEGARTLGGGVSIAEQKEIDLRRRLTMPFDLDRLL